MRFLFITSCIFVVIYASTITPGNWTSMEGGLWKAGKVRNPLFRFHDGIDPGKTLVEICSTQVRCPEVNTTEKSKAYFSLQTK
jgi:hypothetical protein